VTVSSEHRLKRLRHLLAQLERLPPSPERERMLREVRARVVDVDTGIAPSTLLAGHAESALAADARLPARQAPRGVAPAPAAAGHRPRPAAPAEPPEPVRAPHDEAEVVADESFPGPGDRLSRAADEVLSLAADELLSLDDSDPFGPADAQADRAAAPWTRGLRG
jgi:hypothetical protein